MLKYVFFLVFSFVINTFYAQITIAHQSFETSGDDWNFTTSTPACSTDGDSWNYHVSLENIEPSDGIQFWGIRDLNGNCGGTDFESINFSNVDISEFRNVVLSFDYNAFELDNGDDIKFEVFLDNESQGEVLLFEGSSNLSTNGWETASIHIPNTSSQISLTIFIKQNGQDDYLGIDHVKLTGTQRSYCSELMISEYIEGTSSGNYRNNFIEIYNPSNQIVELDGYNLTKYTNDNLDPTGSVSLTGTISAYDTFLIEDATENLGIDSEISTNSSVMDFNGNDKIVLRRNEEIIDIIGIISSNSNFAEDITLRRKSFIQSPNNQYADGEWEIYGLEDTSNLKSHVSSCSGAIPEIEVTGNFHNITDGSLITNAKNNTYFGEVDASLENSINKSFTIKNTGHEMLHIDEIKILGSNASDFTLINTTNPPISPNDSIHFEIGFKPSTKGIKTAMLTIINNDASENPFNFIIKGEGSGSSSSPLMITQYYEGDGNNKWLEITNISENTTQENEYFLALFRNDDANNPIGIKPSVKIVIPVLNAGGIIKYRASLNVNTPEYAIDGTEIKTNICTFDGNDMIIISTTDDESCWINKVDIIGNNSNWGANSSFVRKYGCENVQPSTGFNVEDWFTYNISEINNATEGLNIRIGEYYLGSTTFIENNTWDNGLPDIYRNVIIDAYYNTLANGNLEVCNLTINANSTIEIWAENHITIKNDLTVNGTLEVLHQASLLMINDSGNIENNGIINIHKTTTALKPYDYTYWSSPVKNVALSNVFAASPQNSFYTFETQNYIDADNDSNDDDGNAWQTANGAMEIGKGYTAMAPNTSPFMDTQSVIFSGEVNNGIINMAINLSGDDNNNEDDWNLIGNPYPSAISADSLLNNQHNKAFLSGSIYFWTHSTAANNTQKYCADDYAMYTVGTGGISANSSGCIPSDYIASGQGFFVEAKLQGNIEFNNDMRIKIGNTNFFKSGSLKVDNSNEKDKIWINLYNNEGAFNQILIGFINGASSSYESNYDGLRFDANNYISFYSIVDDQKLAIQGLPPFQGDEIIPIGMTSNIEEEIELNIELAQVKGIFNEQDIYLFDKTLNKLHLLNKEAYTFKIQSKSELPDRFSLQFDNAILNTDAIANDSYENEKLIISKTAQQLIVSTTNKSIISSINIYDILGRNIKHYTTNRSEVIISKNTFNKQGIFILKVQLENSKVLIKKIIL